MDEESQVIDWLMQIAEDPENWQSWYSDSEVKFLAQSALELLKKV